MSEKNRAFDVLLVEDSPSDMLLTKEALTQSGSFRLRTSERLSDALGLLGKSHFDVVLLDLGLPDSQGLETLRRLRGSNPGIAVVVLTGQDDEDLALRAIHEGAEDYLVKARADAGHLQRAIRYALERQVAEAKLRNSEARFLELAQHLRKVLWIIDVEESKILYVSPAYENMWGRTCQSLYDNPRSYMAGIHPEDLPMMQERNAAMYRTGHIDAECRVIRPDGSWRWVSIRGYPVTVKGRMTRLVGTIEDVTERRVLAEERDLLFSRLQLHIERMPLAYVLFDAELRVSDWNPAAARIFGYSKNEALGLNAFALIPESERPRGEELFQRIKWGDMDANPVNENLTADGKVIRCQWFNTPLFEDDGRFAGILCLAQDITEKVAMEERFRQAQKLEAIGSLAGGVAHDFNNLLTIINGYADLVQATLPADSPTAELVREISQAGDRATGLTRQLLAFSRKQVLEPKVLQLNAVVAETTKMLQRLIGEDVDLHTSLDPGLDRVKADPGQIEQILINLAVNARDAMPRGGKLTIQTANVELDETYVESRSDVRPGRHALLSVSDTGSGMDETVKSRIFEPFFTTKEAGSGTGLGLATVFGIVKQSGGHIAVYSEPGLGTSFKIYLPVVDELASSTTAPTEQAALVQGVETILLAEDEPALRALTRHVLQLHGYKVLEAENGTAALRAAEGYDGPIHLLVTDVVMPAMSGRQLAEALVVLRPEMRVLYLSGYTDDAVVRHGVLHAETAFLQKPFTPSGLAHKVRKVLDQ